MRDTATQRSLLLLVAAGVVLGALVAAGWSARDTARTPADGVRLTHTGDVESFLWSHTGPRLLLVRRRGDEPGSRWVADLQSGALAQWSEANPADRASLAGEFGEVDPVRATPQMTLDGSRVANVGSDGLAVVDTASGQATPFLRAGSAPSMFVDSRFVFGPSWAPDGYRLALTVLDASASLPRSLREDLRSLPGPAVVGERAAEMAQAGVRSAIWVVDTRTGYARRALDRGPFDPKSGLTRARLWLQWSPDGRRLGFIRDGDVWATTVRAE